MPAYEITSPASGRTYQVDFAGQPTLDDLDDAANHFDQVATQRETQKPFASVGDTISGIGDALGGLTTTMPAAYYRLREGMSRPDTYSPEARAAFDAEAEYTRQMQQESTNRLIRGEASSTGDTFRSVGNSLGFTGANLAAAIPAGLAGSVIGAKVTAPIAASTGPAAPVVEAVGTVLGGAIGAGSASFGASYRMAGAQFLDDAFTAWEQQQRTQGKTPTEQEREQAYQALLPLAQNSALWEAGPEAVGNAVGLGVAKTVLGLGKPLLTQLAKNALGKIGIKAGALAAGVGTEQATETITQIGQGGEQAKADAFARGEDMSQAVNPYAGPGGAVQAFKDVAPQVLAISGLMMGGGGAIKAGTRLLPARPAPAPGVDPGVPVSPSSTSPLADIAARAGAVDPLLPEDTGDLTAADAAIAADFEAQSSVVPPSGGPVRQPILTGVPDAVSATPTGLLTSELGNSTPPPNSQNEVEVEALIPELFNPALSTGSRSVTPEITEKKNAVARKLEALFGLPSGHLTPMRWNVSKVFKTADGRYLKVGAAADAESLQRLKDQLELAKENPHAVVPELRVLHSAGIYALTQSDAGIEGADLHKSATREDKQLFELLKEQNPFSAETSNGALRVETDTSLKNMALYVGPDGMVRTRAFDFDGVPEDTSQEDVDTAKEVLAKTPLMPGIPLTGFSPAIQKRLTPPPSSPPLETSNLQPETPSGGTYELTSPTTGQTYRVQFEREPQEADLEDAVAQLDAQEPLGMMRPVLFDPLLEQMDSKEFARHFKTAAAKADEIEVRYDKSPELADNPAFRRQMGLLQDQFVAAEMEAFRRENVRKFPGDVFVDFANLTATLGQPDDINASTQDAARARVLWNVLQASGLTEEQVREGMSYQNGALAKDPNFQEVARYRGKRSKEWAQWFTTTQPPSTSATRPATAAPATSVAAENVGGMDAGTTPPVNAAASNTFLDQVLNAALKDETIGELNLDVPPKNQNRESLQRAIDAIQARGLNAATDGKTILIRGFRELRQSPVSPSPSLPISPSSAPPGFTNLDPGARTGGFLNADILAEGAALLQHGFTTFAAWSKAMLTRFGKGIRDALSAIWQQITSPQTNAARNTRLGMPQGTAPVTVGQGGFLTQFAARVLPIHQRGEPFRVKQLGARAILTGSPLPADVTQVLAMTENERQAVAQAAAQVGNDLQAAVKGYLDRTGQDEMATWDRVNAVMEGQPGALALLNAIDPAMGERSRRARNMLDDLSAAVAQTLPTGPLQDAITQNQGSWLRRGYAAFDPESGWNFDGLTKAAKAGRKIGGKDAAKILADASAYLRTQNPQNGRPLKEWNADIEADMRDLMDRDAWQSANLGGVTLRKNVSSFMKRKTIAPEIRALMGEETNPLHRFSKSAAFQAQIVARHHGQTAVRTLGLQTGLFSTQRGGVYTEEIEPSANRWSGLAGVWTTPEMKAALAATSTVNREGTDVGGWIVGTLKALGNEAKLNRVALNPDSWVVNILGNVVGLVLSGDVFAWDFARRLTDARALVKSGKARPSSMQTAAQSAVLDAQRAMMARLRGMGVVGSSITLADIEASIPKHLLQWVAEDQARNAALGAVKGAIVGQAIGRGLGLPGRVVGGVAGGIGGAIAGAQRLQNWQQKVADYVMTGPDALARVTGWLTNYETALAAGQTTDQAAAWASERTLNTFPNYNKLPALLRQLSRLGFTGSFIAFQWEVYRNFGWNVKYAIDELRSRDPAIQARGLRRLAGVGSVAALAGGGLAALLAATGTAAGDDDERNKIWRQWFAAPWEKDAVLAFDKYDQNGVSYYNTSYLLPQVTMMELIQGASEGTDPADSASRVVNRLTEQFLNGSVHLQPLLSAFANQDRFGRKITNAEGLAGALDRADEAAQTILEPGFADKLTRLTYALRQAEKNGRKFSVMEEMKRLVGIRQVSRTWEELVKRRYSKFTYDYQAARDDANKMLGENLPGAPVKAVKFVNDRVVELEKQLTDYERDLRRLGVPETTIKAAKKDSSLQRLNPVRVRADGKRVEAVTVR